MKGMDVIGPYLSVELPVIEIHTSDRQTYKRCRRRFEWGSTLGRNLIRIGPDQKAFFLGSGFHFAMEDFYGYQRFSHPTLAYAAYHDATKADERPEEADELLELAFGMISYYVDHWLDEHPEPWETLWVDGVPQVEVEVGIHLNDILLEEIERRRAYLHNFDLLAKVEDVIRNNDIIYVTTYDRVVIEPKYERLYGFDTKTAAQFDELNLQTNPQSGSYNWSMDLFYTPVGFKPEGIVWQQHKKAVPRAPELVNVGKANEGLSTDKRLLTTYSIYKKAVQEHHGTIPERYLDILAMLGNLQDNDSDPFVRREVLRLNKYQRRAEQEKIVQEVLEMLDPDLPMYPNPTKDCSWDCPFKDPCLAKDDGSDFEHFLANDYASWKGYKDDWRTRVKYPDGKKSTSTITADITP